MNEKDLSTEELTPRLYVSGLSPQVTEEKLKALFEQVGVVTFCNIILDRDSGRPRGFAFVEMESETAAEKARKRFSGKEFEGKKLRVTEARPAKRVKVKKKKRKRRVRRFLWAP